MQLGKLPPGALSAATVSLKYEQFKPVTINERPIRRVWKKRVYYVSRCGYPKCKVKFGAWSAELVAKNKDAHEAKHLSDDVKKARRRELEKNIKG
jgi:hypothetical protein